MNYDVLLGIDWLQKHNPLIDWETNQLTFSCCGMNLIHFGSGDARPPNPVVPFEEGDVLSSPTNLAYGLSDLSIHAAVISAEETFAFGLTHLKSNSSTITAVTTELTPKILRLYQVQGARKVPWMY